MELELKHFKLVVALAETGNMTKAADSLFLTQSALSHQLKDAEERVGVPLFSRKNKRLTLTPAGQQFVMMSREVIGQVHEGIKVIRHNAHIETRKLRVQAGCFTSFSWIPAILSEYSMRFPKVEIEIAATLKDPIADLLQKNSDIAIVNQEIRNKQLMFEELFSDQLLIIMSPHHRLARKPTLDMRELDGENIVIYNVPDSDSTLISDIMKPVGAKPGRVIRLDLTEGIVEAIKAGLGIGILSNWAAAPFVDQGSLVTRPAGKKGFHRTWKAVVRKADYSQSHVQELFNLLKTQLKRRL